jgi:hypothetical protein
MTTAQFPPTLGAKSPERDRSLNRPRRKRSIAHHRKSRRLHSKPFRHRMPAPIPWAGKTVKPGIYFIDRMWLKIQIKYRMQDIQSENSKKADQSNRAPSYAIRGKPLCAMGLVICHALFAGVFPRLAESPPSVTGCHPGPRARDPIHQVAPALVEGWIPVTSTGMTGESYGVAVQNKSEGRFTSHCA